MNVNNNDITKQATGSSATLTGLVHSTERHVADYEKAEVEQLINSLKRSYTDRFFVMTPLMKRGIMMKNAKITHKPFIPSSEK